MSPMIGKVSATAEHPYRDKNRSRPCSIRPPHFDILWLPRTAMRSVERDPSDCILVVGVSRPKMALCIVAVMLFSLFLTFHMIYDSAVHSLQQAANAGEIHHKQYANKPSDRLFTEKHRAPLLLLSRHFYPSASSPPPSTSFNATLHLLRYNNDSTIIGRVSLTRRLPQAIIIGVRKCGTRALLEMLHMHPRVQKAAGEVHFFDRDDNYNRGLEWYRMRMPHSYAGQVTIEKSPSYFVTAEVPERIRAMNASVKLLLIVREPVTRAISDYTQLRAHATSTSFAPTASVPPTVFASRTFEQLALHPNGSINGAYRPLAISVYHHYVHRWLETFPREQILVLNGDLLIEDPLPLLQRIEQFLGLEPKIRASNFYFNETKGFYCLRNETSDRCLRETKGRRHPRVDPRTVSKLRRYFGEHNQRFYELVGEDLGWPED